MPPLKRVMLVDDDQDDQDFFVSIVKSVDPSVVCNTAENGVSALKMLNDGAQLPEIIFLDLNMPVMNGKQFLKEIKSNDSLQSIPIVVLSTSSDEATISEVMHLGASDFITKPNKLSLLVPRVKEILDRREFFRNC